MAKGPIGDAEVGAFNADGFVLVRGMLDAVEVDLLGRAARADRVLDQHAFGRADGEGGTVRLSLWNHPTDTIYGMIARSESIVGSMEKLLGGEVYHYHSKMIMKDPLTGGAWTWHQDYGYWYHNGCPQSVDGQRLHRGRPRHARERLPAGGARLASAGPHRSRPHRRTGRSGHRASAGGPEAAGARARRDGTGRRPLLPLQHAASIGPEQVAEPALVDDLQLQRRAQRPLQGIAASSLYAARQSSGQQDSRVWGAAIQRRRGERRLARRGARHDRAELLRRPS